MVFPGGALLGCSAGLGQRAADQRQPHAMLSGKAAAEAAHAAIKDGRSADELSDYEANVRSGPIAKDLKRVRNVKPLWSKFGLVASLVLGGFDMWVANVTGWNQLGTIKHGKTDAAATGKASDHEMLNYPRADGKLSFDRLTNVSFSATNHEEEQPSHLQLADDTIPVGINLPQFAEPAQRYCPAGVYEILTDDDGSNPRFQINAQNCVHCKTCDIKDPSQNITWATPQGGEGPNYPNM